jgi:hypothetical protein
MDTSLICAMNWTRQGHEGRTEKPSPTCHFTWQILNTWYVTPLQHPVHALQILAAFMPQYHRCILPRVKMGIFICTKVVSPFKFECDFNALIFYHNRTRIEWAILLLQNISGNGNSLPYAFGTVNSCNRINIVNPSIYITAHSGITVFFFLVSEQFLFNRVFGVLLLETGFLMWKSWVSSRNRGFWIELFE